MGNDPQTSADYVASQVSSGIVVGRNDETNTGSISISSLSEHPAYRSQVDETIDHAMANYGDLLRRLAD